MRYAIFVTNKEDLPKTEQTLDNTKGIEKWDTGKTTYFVDSEMSWEEIIELFPHACVAVSHTDHHD